MKMTARRKLRPKINTYQKPQSKSKTKLHELFIYDANHLVIIEEEFGYDNWLWLPDFPLDELPEFWNSLVDIPITNPISLLPGKIVNIDYPRKPKLAKFLKKIESQPHYFMHLFTNEHSFLKTPNKDKLYPCALMKKNT